MSSRMVITPLHTGRAGRRGGLILLLFIWAALGLHAEDGSRLWLRGDMPKDITLKIDPTMPDDDGYRILACRGAVIAFRKACILYLMNGRKWSREIEDFCRWSFDYDMWVKMSLFSEPLAEEREVEYKVRRGGISNNLELLSDVFTRQDAYDLRVRLGKKNPNPKDMLGQWTARGFIVYDKATGKYLKTQKYLSSHVA